jgi:hypothetical protein
MEKTTEKRFPTIACCGIDCGLCPRFYTEGKSKCPGCAGEKFAELHPSCGILTCCFKNNGYETCAECTEFPCNRMKNWDIADSFVTHKKTLSNLQLIKKKEINEFSKQQNERINYLNILLNDYDDGRSKSYYCLAAALIELEDLSHIIKQVKKLDNSQLDKKQIAKQARNIIEQVAQAKNVELIYRRIKA